MITDGKITFTKDQEKAVTGILEAINDGFHTVIGLTGSAGSGKSTVIRYIINNCGLKRSSIICATPTHKACRVVAEMIGYGTIHTLHSLFGYQMNTQKEKFDTNNTIFDPIGKVKLDMCRLLIVDEGSMIPAKLVTHMIASCRERGIILILLGDENQLAPVNENRSAAFKFCAKIYRLKEIVRQDENNPMNPLLVMLRKDIDRGTNEFINFIASSEDVDKYDSSGNGYSICGMEKFTELVNNYFSDPDYEKDVNMNRIVAYTNSQVIAWNKYVRNLIIPDSSKGVITMNDLVIMLRSLMDNYSSPITTNGEEYIVREIADYMNELGMKGYMVRLQRIHGGDVTRKLFVIDHSDNFTLNTYCNESWKLASDARNAKSPLGRTIGWKKYYKFTNSNLIITNIYDSTGKLIQERDMDYGFALSAHRSQGSTFNNVFVDFHNMVFDKAGNLYSDMNTIKRLLYVGCSRARNKLIIMRTKA